MVNRITPEQKVILEDYVSFEDGGKNKHRWTCKRCNHSWTGRPNRIISHLLGLIKRGIKPCSHMSTLEKTHLKRRLGLNLQQQQIPMEGFCSMSDSLQDNNDGIQGTNAEHSELISPIPQGQFSQHDSAQIFSTQGGTDMVMRDPVPPPSQGNFNQTNDQCRHPLQGGSGIYTSTHGNKLGDEMFSAHGSVGEPQAPCLPWQDDGLGMDPSTEFPPLSTLFLDSPFAGMASDDQTPTLAPSAFNNVNGQYTHPLQDGVRINTSTPGNASGGEVNSDHMHDQHTPPSVSRFLSTPSETPGASMMVPPEECTNDDGAQETNAVGSEPINTIHHGQSSQPESTQVSFPQGGMDNGTGDPISTAPRVNSDRMHDQHTRRWQAFAPAMIDSVPRYRARFQILVDKIEWIIIIGKRITRIETELECAFLGRERKIEMNLWVEHAARLKREVNGLHLKPIEAVSHEEILSQLWHVDELIKIADILIETGTSLLKPVVPEDLFNTSCSSQLLNGMPPGQLPQQVV